jgi:hypothetical protein
MQRPETMDVLDDEMVEVYRQMSGAERLRIAFGLFASARRMLTNHLRSEHPDWDEETIQREVARRISRGVVDGSG